METLIRYKAEIGKVFSRLTVVDVFNENKKWRYLCKCSCGNEKVVERGNVINGLTKSCGCLRIEMGKTKTKTHGKAKTSTYTIWSQIIQRCENKNSPAYKNYGGRGIIVCKEWHSFENFIRDMGERPKGMSIDRIDNSAGYDKNNCRWATREEQSRNRRNNINITYKGTTMCMNEWARETGLHRITISRRLKKGLSIKKVLTKY